MHALRLQELNSRFSQVLAEHAIKEYGGSFKHTYICRQRSCFTKIHSEVVLSKDKQFCVRCIIK